MFSSYFVFAMNRIRMYRNNVEERDSDIVCSVSGIHCYPPANYYVDCAIIIIMTGGHQRKQHLMTTVSGRNARVGSGKQLVQEADIEQHDSNRNTGKLLYTVFLESLSKFYVI